MRTISQGKQKGKQRKQSWNNVIARLIEIYIVFDIFTAIGGQYKKFMQSEKHQATQVR